MGKRENRCQDALKKLLVVLPIIGFICVTSTFLLCAERKSLHTVREELYQPQQEGENVWGKYNFSSKPQDKSTAPRHWNIFLMGIYGFSRMKYLNDNIRSLNAGFSGDMNTIKAALGGSLSLTRQLNPFVEAGLSYEFLRSSSQGTLVLSFFEPPVTVRHKVTISTHGIMGIIALRVPVNIERVEIKGIAGAGIYLTRYSEAHFNFNENDDGVSLGLRAGVCFRYLLTAQFGICGEACYRMITLKVPGGIPDIFPPIYAIGYAQADLNGFGLSLGICIAL